MERSVLAALVPPSVSAPSRPEGGRDPHVDLLRASAILLVVVYHVSQRVLFEYPAVTRITRFGEHGVDLFFVLSGWLIGGLLWRELRAHGDLEVGRFIGRRALRTIPPYLAALLLYSVAHVTVKGGELDWGYLLFFQNYYHKLPYFLISWSLCVEEHFYLVVPAATLLIHRFARPLVPYLLVAGAALPAFFRFVEYQAGQGAVFGYPLTATHLRYEGLLLGVFASFLRCNRPDAWSAFRRMGPWFAGAAVAGMVVIGLLSERAQYVWFYLAVAVCFVSVLFVGAEAPARGLVRWSVVYWVAVTSYSVYLTHALAIELAARIGDRLELGIVSRIGLSFVTIAIAGGIFYWIVEVTTLRLRSRVLPGRRMAPAANS